MSNDEIRTIEIRGSYEKMVREIFDDERLRNNFRVVLDNLFADAPLQTFTSKYVLLRTFNGKRPLERAKCREDETFLNKTCLIPDNIFHADYYHHPEVDNRVVVMLTVKENLACSYMFNWFRFGFHLQQITDNEPIHCNMGHRLSTMAECEIIAHLSMIAYDTIALPVLREYPLQACWSGFVMEEYL